MNKTKDIISDDELNDENTKIRVTTYIDLDILKKLKIMAKKENSKYQTILNSILREKLFAEHTIEKEINDLKHRLELIEKKVS